MSLRLVRIHPLGGLGNQMFQLMFAEAIRLAVGDVTIAGHDLPEWGLRGAPPPSPRAVAIDCRAHVIPLTAIVEFMRATPDVEVGESRISGDSVLVPTGHDEIAARYAPHLGTEGLAIPAVPVSLGPGGVRASRGAAPLSRRVMGAPRRRLAVSRPPA